MEFGSLNVSHFSAEKQLLCPSPLGAVAQQMLSLWGPPSCTAGAEAEAPGGSTHQQTLQLGLK